MKTTLLHILVACSVSVAVFVGQGFWYSVVAEKSSAVAYLQGQINARSEAAGRIASSRAELAKIADDEITVRSYFVSENDIVVFIDGLQARGLSQGTIVKVLSVSAGGTNARPTLTLAVTVTGAFDAVMRTVGSIEYAPYDISISKFSVMKSDKKNWLANLELVVGSVHKP
ncbi:MAG: hypothetical protein AAB517_01905 [Patescibacteria group bacterium]